MPSLAAFNNFVRTTGEKVKTPPDQIINDAVKNTYMFNRMLKGRGVTDSVQSGDRIVDFIMLKDSGTAQFVQPNQDLDILNVDTIEEHRADWRFIVNHFSYTQQEVVLNSGDPQTYYKNLLKVKRQQTHTDTFNTMEEQLWATPSNADMEAQTGTNPFSIPTFVTEDGLAPAGFTTVMGLNPSNEVNWRNQVRTYDPADPTDPDNGIVQAMDNLFMDVRFKAPRDKAQYYESDDLQQMMIATNRNGRAIYLLLTRDSNDRLVGADLGHHQNSLDYSGLPVEYIAELDNAGYADGSPRYFFLNLKYLHPIFHTTEYMKEEPPIRHPRQPYSYVVWHTTYYNVWCSSRRRQGIIAPSS
jgi:hypothetical protein